MSGKTEWNTKEIRDFKLAFGTRNDRGFFSSEPPHNPNAAFQQARDMLDKRRVEGGRTWMELADRHDQMPDNTMLRELADRADGLNDVTGQLLADVAPADPDKATQALLRTTDLWVAFEASCISAGNAMKLAGTGDRLRAELNEQALQLLDMIAPLRELADDAPPPRALGQVETELVRMTALAGGDGSTITDTLAFSEQLQQCRQQLNGLTKVVADSSSKSADVYQMAIKKMYGIEVKPSQVFGFPYENFLDTLAMVPPDHARNWAMTEIVGEFLGLSVGGDYDESPKDLPKGAKGGRIRINPVIKLNLLGKPFEDPETHEAVRIDQWKGTTLHEIGHAVDHAYGLMNDHGKDKGCGGWQQQDPLVYMQPQRQTFQNALARCGVAEAPFTSRIAGDAFDGILINATSGSMKPGELREPLEAFWCGIYDLEYYPTSAAAKVDAQIQAATGACQVIGMRLSISFPDGRMAADPETARSAFIAQGSNATHIATLTARPAIVDPASFLDKLNGLAQNPTTHAATVAQWMEKIVQDFEARHEKAKVEAKAGMVARWTDAVLDCLPRPVDLEPYLADSKPWKTDLSKVKINGQPASQESYKGQTKWWRYDAGDRQATYVSDYQWRAPGEWFAELYAITWFKKVDPPGGVGQAVRPYLFGGHLRPDEAV